MNKLHTILNIIRTISILAFTAILIPIAIAAKPQNTIKQAPFIAPPTPQEFQNKVLITVNGQPITTGMFIAYLSSRTQKNPQIQNSRQLQFAVFNDLINLVLLAQVAKKNNLDKQPQVATLLELQRKELLSQLVLQDQLTKITPSEQQLQEAYKQQYGTPKEEYKAAHILVKTEAEAKAILEKLNQGADFETLAKEKSIDSNASQGGSLGWFNPAQMVKTFADSLTSMTIGSISVAPVKTQFGWHIIKLEDKRTITPPEYTVVRPTLVAKAQRQALTDYIKQIRQEAKIEMQAPLSNSNSITK